MKKSWFDKKAKRRVFSPGDQVLMLLLLPGSALQAQYSGPYVTERQVSQCDYMVRTPDRKRKTQLCHVNLLKPYVARSLLSEVNPLAALAPPSFSSVPVDSRCGDASADADEVNHLTKVSCARLTNSEILAGLDTYLSHLKTSERHDVKQLINKNLASVLVN